MSDDSQETTTNHEAAEETGSDPTRAGVGAPTEDPRDKLRDSLTDFKEDLQEEVRELVRAKKAAEQLCRSGALENLELVRKYTDWLRDADLSVLAMDDRRQGAVASLDRFVERRRQTRRMQFMRALDHRIEDRDCTLEKLGDNPLTFYLEPLTVEVNFDTEEVDLQYARMPLEETTLDPEAVLEAHREAVERLTERAIPSEMFFDRLHFAYQLAYRARGGSPGDRVNLVDLLTPLAVLWSDAESWSHADLTDLSPYPRPLFAYQLAQLRRDGVLADDGRRLDLGTATGGSTEDKNRVIFIPSGPGDGQYYLSIRFTDVD